MKKVVRHSVHGGLIGLLCTLAMTGCTSTTIAQPESALPHYVPVTYSWIDAAKYAVFVTPWDEPLHPVKCALITSVADWQAILAPAAVMSTQPQRFAPSDDWFDTHDVLLVARAMPISEDRQRVWHVEQVTQRQDVMSVRYTWHPPEHPGSSSVRSFFMISVPKAASAQAHRIRFIENGRDVCVLPHTTIAAPSDIVKQFRLDGVDGRALGPFPDPCRLARQDTQSGDHSTPGPPRRDNPLCLQVQQADVRRAFPSYGLPTGQAQEN